MAEAKRDENHVTTLLGVSDSDGVTPVVVYADPVTHRLLVDSAGGGMGTVTSVSVVTANGFAGTVANATTTPAITLTTTVTGLLKGNGTAISAAVAGTDYQVPIVFTTTGTSGAATFNGTTLNIPVYQAAGTYVTSVTGTANRITSSGGTTPQIDIAATYVGQTSITTLGTVTSGTLSTGAVIAGVTMTLGSDGTGDIYYRSAGGVLTRLGIGSSTNVLTVSGGLPAWSAAPAASLVVGTTTISSGTTTRILYDNAGVLGEYTLTGSGTVVAMATAPTFVTSITTPSVLATANDSGALGASGTAFADLFLASGGVINWAANNVALTHSTGILTQTAGELRITSANVGTNADSVPTLSSTSTLTNKTLIASTNVTTEITTTTDSATPTPTGGSLQNAFSVTALAQAATFGAPSGSPANWNKLIIRIKDNGTARALSWNAAYVAGGVALPTTTVISKILTVGFIYNTDNSLNKWMCVASAQEA